MAFFRLVDAYDGRTIKVMYRVSTLQAARKEARKFSAHTHDDFSLIRENGDGTRDLIHTYAPRATPPKGAVSSLGRRP